MPNAARRAAPFILLAALAWGHAAYALDGDLSLSRHSLGSRSGTNRIDVTIHYSDAVDTVFVTSELQRTGEVPDTLWNTRDATLDGLFTRAWTGNDVQGVPVSDGRYAFVTTLRDAATSITLTDTVTVDRKGPVIESFALAGPAGAFRNGDYIALSARFDEDPIAIDLTVAADTDTESVPLIENHGDHSFGVLYRLSPMNQHADGRNLPITLTVRDSLQNESESDDVTICLSNHPPLLFDSALIDANGVEVPDSVTFSRSQEVRVMAIFQAAFDTLTTTLPFTYHADFSQVDTQFSLSRPAHLDSVFVAPLPDSLLAPGYRFFARVEYSYVLSEENRTPEGRHEVIINASDAGCGIAESDSIFMTLDNLRPPAPVLFEPALETTRSATLVLSGEAPGAGQVTVTRVADRATFAAVVDTASGAFTATVALVPGANAFTAVAHGRFGHPSLVSNEVVVVLTPDTRVEVPSRFAPGDTFRVTSLESASRIDLDVFDMTSRRIWSDTATDPGELHDFIWDGRNQSGDRALSGPYIARVTLFLTNGKRTLTEAFVFTRQ